MACSYAEPEKFSLYAPSLWSVLIPSSNLCLCHQNCLISSGFQTTSMRVECSARLILPSICSPYQVRTHTIMKLLSFPNFLYHPPISSNTSFLSRSELSFQHFIELIECVFSRWKYVSHRTHWQRLHFGLVFGRYSVRNSAWTAAILTEVFRGYFLSVQANGGIKPRLGYVGFLQDLFSILHSSVTPPFDAVQPTRSLEQWF